MRIRILFALTSFVACVALAQTDAQHAAQEAQAKQKLDQVRAEIKKITDAERQISEQRGGAVSALREQELKVAAASKELRALDQQLASQQGKLDRLQKDRDALDSETQGSARSARRAGAFGVRDGPWRRTEAAARAGSHRRHQPHARLLPLFRAGARRRDQWAAEGSRCAGQSAGRDRKGDRRTAGHARPARRAIETVRRRTRAARESTRRTRFRAERPARAPRRARQGRKGDRRSHRQTARHLRRHPQTARRRGTLRAIARSIELAAPRSGGFGFRLARERRSGQRRTAHRGEGRQ